MNPNKDIFDRFRENQHKLNESPSHLAWERLESRLDQHKDRNQKSIYRILSMAAAVLVLVVFVSVISLMLNPKTDQMALLNASPDGFATEELKVVSVSNEINNQILAYQRRYNNLFSSPIQEGKANKKLIAKTDIQHPAGNQNNLAEIAQKEQPQSFSFARTMTETKSEKMEHFSTGMADAARESYAEAADDKAAFDSTIATALPPSDINDDEVYSLDYKIMPEAEKAAGEVDSQSSGRAKLKAEKPAAAKKDQTSATEPLMQPSSAAGYGNSMDSGIRQFQWLTGKWEGNVNNQVSIEQWKQVNSKTIEGSGFLMLNNQSTFHENMKIQEIDGLIYFIADLNGTGNQIHYKLVSNDGFKAVFENQTIDFPNQVVLQRTNSTNFSTIYQNTQPGAINETQQNYYLNRNFIQKEQVVRNLRRVGD